ncbi:hypothetical protein BT93_L2908 [Corymbia citriodora subsp. variegata]|uniref:Uncharacterized protein n=1 Tax=Corymbia citriodora subsp. variegata TaxID=360336 RepID=A0A8T0CL21_CORYI|nr:hypothetical protein BT93_L2908 [Corymbia citriodora subsp. variegata]KAF7847490.1 hypothetical protein BT93_L2908 [Corymbia citriodora subsp. variegata]KAF7847491.1 hypothetical protein BT93_L2908 [Corymbia citriodora subsp. variegata]KAF7847492.1 hypothetical protein BT93_L2908 [Corymbia citriodora subsp. variegata]
MTTQSRVFRKRIATKDHVSSPPAAAVPSVAFQLPSLNIGIGKGKQIVRSTGDNAAVTSRSHVLSLHVVHHLRIHAPRAGSDPRASRKNVAISTRNDLGKFPPA